MAERESTLIVNLAPSGFQSALRRMQDLTRQAGADMGRSLKDPLNAGLKSANTALASLMSDLKQGVKTAATLGGALAVGSFVKDAALMQSAYMNMAFQVNKVAGNSETWMSIQKLVNAQVEETGQSADKLADTFMTVFQGTGSIDAARAAIGAVGKTATATGEDMGQLSAATQMAMSKFGIKTPQEALARIIAGTGTGGKSVEQMSGSFVMLAEAAAAAGHTGGESMTMLLNLITKIGDKAEPGLAAMFQSMKAGSGQVLALQKRLGYGVKFTADMTALERVRTTLMSTSGRKAAEQVFTGNTRIVYDKLAEPFDLAYKTVLKDSKGNAKAALAAGLKAFDDNLREASTSAMTFAEIEEAATRRMATDPAKKLEMAIDKIKTAFSEPQVLAALDVLARKLPIFADAVVKIIGYIVENPWQSLAGIVGGKLALAFGSSAVSSAIASGMTSLFARMAAVQAASAAATGAGALGIGGAVATGAAAPLATTATGATLATAVTAATVAAGVLAAGAVGAAAGYAIYKGVIEKDQEGEFDAVHEAHSTLSTAGQAKNEEQIQKALLELNAAKSNLDKGSTTNDIVGFFARPFMDEGAGQHGDPRKQAESEIVAEQKRLTEALKTLRESAGGLSGVLRNAGGGSGSSRGPLRPADTNPGARPVTG